MTCGGTLSRVTPWGRGVAAVMIVGVEPVLEGGGTLAWDFFERRMIDKVAWFIAPKVLGGSASGPVAGTGVKSLADAIWLRNHLIETLEEANTPRRPGDRARLGRAEGQRRQA